MAKMFYTLAETAEKLGATEDAVKSMASQGKLQQFRDRDKLMFKRDQVDALSAAKGEDDEVTGISSGAIPLDETGLSTGEIPLAGASDQISLADDDELPGAKKKKNKSEDSRMATGISVFDAGEIEEADAHAQTIVKPVEDEEELALESVGSGSGLLDLTQESDDTSLGAELLDEIYPTEGSDQKQGVGSSGAFAPAGAGASFEASGASGLEYAAGGAPVYVEAVEAPDPGGTGLAVGAMIVGLAVLVVGLIVAFSIVQGSPQSLTAKLAGPGGAEDKTALYVMIGGLGATLVFALVGWLIGRSQAGKSAA